MPLSNNNKVVGFFKSIKSEFTRITWASKEETKKSIVSIFAFIVVCALLTAGFDYLFGAIVKLVLNLK